jgi:hypothetical protein
MGTSILTEDEFNHAVASMRKLVWAESSEREKIQALGINVIPADFYSNIPSISEIQNSYEYEDATAPYLDTNIFDKKFLRDELSSLIDYSKDFTPETDGDEKNCNQFFWENSQFSYSDAMSYHAYIRRIKPKTIIEIGSGFSSLIALNALKKNGMGVDVY